MKKTEKQVMNVERDVSWMYFLTSSLRTPRNINLTIFLGKNAKNRAFLV